MKKRFGVVVLVLVLAVSGFAYAQNYRAELSDEQWTELEAIWEKQQELDEELLAKMVEFGTISQERADWMQSNWQSRQEDNDFKDARRFGREECHGGRMMGRKMGGQRMMGSRMMGGWRR